MGDGEKVRDMVRQRVELRDKQQADLRETIQELFLESL